MGIGRGAMQLPSWPATKNTGVAAAWSLPVAAALPRPHIRKDTTGEKGVDERSSDEVRQPRSQPEILPPSRPGRRRAGDPGPPIPGPHMAGPHMAGPDMPGPRMGFEARG